MRITRYLFLMAALLCSVIAKGQDDFNPTAPPEPETLYQLRLQANPPEAATLTGAGRYVVNSSVTVRSTASNAKWQFVNWTDASSQVISTNSSFNYSMSNSDATLTANYTQVSTSNVTLSITPTGAGYISSGSTGTYVVGKELTLTCYNHSNYVFKEWTTKEGTLVSTDNSFKYTVTESDVELVAHFTFSPGAPAEPTETKPKHSVFMTVSPAGAGWLSQTSGIKVTEDASVSVAAYNYTGWVFKAWEIGGVEVGTTYIYTVNMGTEDIYLTARYEFSPGNPAHPGTVAEDIYTLYGNTVELYKGSSTVFPLYLENSGDVTALSFSMKVPNSIVLNTDGATTTSRTSGYTLSATQTAGQDSTLYNFTLSGGSQIADNNGIIINIPISANESATMGQYVLSFVEGIAANGATENNLTFRSGRVNLQLDESNLRAQYSFDRYMNKVLFTNLSSDEAVSFVWDFGDGTTSTEVSPLHVYENAGNYNVKLTAKGVSIENVAEQIIVISPSTSWSASGDYTLNDTIIGVRNFGNLKETVTLLSQCKVDGNISIQVRDDSIFTIYATDTQVLTEIETLTTKLVAAKKNILFSASNGHNATLDWITNADATSFNTVMELALSLQMQNVTFKINGEPIDIAALKALKSQTICSGEATTLVALTSLSTSANITTSWEAVVKSGSILSDYELSGTGDIPAMTITNGATTLDSVQYHATIKLNNVAMYTYIYKVYIRPLLSNSTLTYSAPDADAEVLSGSVALRWSGITAAQSYILTIQRSLNGTITNDTVKGLTAMQYNLSAVPGASYTWKVTAVGACDNIDGGERTFTVRKQSNLTVAEVITPSDAKGNSTLEVKATITNAGEGKTARTGWYDAIYSSTTSGTFATSTFITQIYHSGALDAGNSYEVTFSVTTPNTSLGQVYYYVKADNNSSEGETNETDNVKESQCVILAANYVDSVDYKSLVKLYQATNGAVWTSNWRINSTVIASGYWPGVTFDNDGHVTAINLTSFGLSGALPTNDFLLPELTTLNLSKNQLTGDAASFVKNCPKLQTLNMSYNRLNTLSDTLSSLITSLNFSYQFSDASLSSLPIQNWEMGTSVGTVTFDSLMMYNHTDKAFTAHPRLQIYSAANSFIGYLTYSSGAYQLSISGDYTLANNAELIVRPNEGVAAYSRMRASFSFTMGDANVDKSIDVLDAQQTLNRIMLRQSGNFNYTAANTYADALLNVQDIVSTINLFIADEQGGVEGIAAKRIGGEDAGNCIYAEEGKICLSTLTPVAALDLTIQGVTASQLSLRLSKNKFQMVTHDQANGVRVVIFSPSGDEIPLGNITLLKMSVEGEPIEVIGSDVNAQPVTINIGNRATGITSITKNAVTLSSENHSINIQAANPLTQCRLRVYDLNGILLTDCSWEELPSGNTKIASEAKGLCIIKIEAEEISTVTQRLFIK